MQIKVKIMPNAHANQINSVLSDGTFKIKIKAQPISGKANKELIAFLADILSIRKSNVIIISGEKSRNKIIELEGIEEKKFYEILENIKLRK